VKKDQDVHKIQPPTQLVGHPEGTKPKTGEGTRIKTRKKATFNLRDLIYINLYKTTKQ
jgi:hypothetical protein